MPEPRAEAPNEAAPTGGVVPAAQAPSAEAGPEPPHGGGRVLLALISGQVGLHAGMAGLRMAAPLQALHEGYSAWAVGLLLALFAAAPVVLALQAGRLADRHGYHRPVHIAVGLAVLGMALAVVSTWLSGPLHFGLLCVAAMLAGSGANMGMLTIQRTAGLAARDATERVRIFSWLGVAPSFSNVLGPVGVGLVIDAWGFAAGYGLLLALPLLTLWSARSVPPSAPTPAPAVARRGAAGAWDLLKLPGMARLLWVNFLLSSCWDVHGFAVPILGHEKGYSASTIGLILGSFTLSVTGVRLLIPALAHRLRPAGVVTAAMLGTALVFALYPLAPGPLWMGACAVLLGVTLGSVQPMVMSTLHHITPEHRHGEALAVRSMCINGCSALMPLLFGAAGTWVGAAVLFWVVGAAVGGGAWSARRLGLAR